MLQFENQYRATNAKTDLDDKFLNGITRSIDARIHKLELIEKEWLAEARKLVELGQARIDLVLQPAVDSISRQVELGFLQATVSSAVTFQAGVVNLTLAEGDDRQFFRPSPFVVLTRVDNANDYAVGRVTAPYDSVTGELQIDVIDFTAATAGPFADCIISVTSGAALAAIQVSAAIQQAKTDAIQARADAVAAAGAAAAAGLSAGDSATDASQSKTLAEIAAGDAAAAAAIVSSLGAQITALDAISAEIASVAAGLTDITTVAANIAAISNAAALVTGLTATDITSAPTGNLAATNVQAALTELDAELQAIPPGGTHDFVASGAISPGSFAALNSDGSVSIVAETVTAANAGTPVEFEAADVANSCAAFNPAEGVVVVAYADNGNSGHLTAIAGTVNGGSILFGDPVVLHAAAVAHIEITNCKSSESKLFVSYQNSDNFSYGTGVVLSVSVTVITPGAPVVFESATTTNTACCYDQSVDRVFVAYTDGGNSSYSTYIAASISGTVPTFGTAAVFNATTGVVHGCYFDESINNVITCYENNLTDGYLVAATIVGTVAYFGSGVTFYTNNPRDVAICSAGPGRTAVLYQRGSAPSSGVNCRIATTVSKVITFAADVAVNTEDCGYQLRAVYDSFTGSVIAIFVNTENVTSVLHIGVADGDSISFGSENVFTADNAYGDDIGATFDTNANRAVITYSKSFADFGQAVVWQTGFTSTNSNAWIGLATAIVPDAATGTFTTIGGVNDQQSGLSVGASYYLSNTGSLTTTITANKVGKALSATELFVTG